MDPPPRGRGRGRAENLGEAADPGYDVHRTGYPQRKRDYDARQRILKRRAMDEGA
ncbi:Uncharacterised protein [Mycobacteroides abscessus]|nr:Uncharacterised protein [Mycobacteroides abscessus]